MTKKNKTKKLLRRASLLYRMLSDNCTQKPLNSQEPFELSGLHVCTLKISAVSELALKLLEMGIDNGPVYWKEFAIINPEGGGLLVLDDVTISKPSDSDDFGLEPGIMKIELSGTLKTSQE